MRVAIVHDDLVQWGGAERVLLGLLEIYPDADIFTSVYDKGNLLLAEHFKTKKIHVSFLQNIYGWKKLYKILLPFYGLAFEQFDFSVYDIVISNTTRFAKSIITKPETQHICYCHTPPRFLWHFSGIVGFGLVELLMTKLRIYDQISAQRVDQYIAGSENAKKRIQKIYRRDSEVIYPFIDKERFKNVESFDGGYLCLVGRPNKYKKYELAVNVCRKLKIPLKIINGGIGEELVIRILSGCRALVVPGIEDFGMVSLEAQFLGKPIVAYGMGGSLETVIPGKTGILFSGQTEDSLQEAILKLNSLKINPIDCKTNAENFSKERFMKKFQQAVADLV